MIGADFLQKIKLIDFDGGITYNENGYAVLPEYEIVNILASVQPTPKSEIKFLPEGTHYGDFIDILTDYQVDVDNSPSNLGDYFIYKNNVYKIFSSQDFKQFSSFSTNHIETTVARDNRIVYDSDTNTINLPFPQIDSSFAPLFDLIKMVAFCFPSPNELVVLWGFQQELRPDFPFCMVNIEQVINPEITNFQGINSDNLKLETNINKELIVSFHFYAYDKVQAITLMETFKLNRSNFTFSSEVISCAGFVDNPNEMTEELYENRTIFHGSVLLRFGWVVQEQSTNTANTIEHAASNLSIQ